jgi:hypothetical protein
VIPVSVWIEAGSELAWKEPSSASSIMNKMSRMGPLSGQRDWGGTATPETGLAAAVKRPHQKGSKQGRLPDGPPKTNA